MRFSAIFLLFFSTIFFSQSPLQLKVRTNLELMKSEIDSAYSELKNLQNTAQNQNDQLAVLEARNNLAYYYYLKAEYGKSYDEAKILKNEAQKIKNLRLQTLAMNRIGAALTFLELFEDAEKQLLATQKFIKANNFEDKNLILATNYQFLSDLYFKQNNFDKAILEIKKTITEYEKIKDQQERESQLAKAYSNIGIRYITKDYDSSRSYIQRSFEIQKPVAIKNFNVVNYNALAEMAIADQNYQSAVDYLKKAEELNKKVNVNYYWVTIYELFQKSYAGLGDQSNYEKYKMLHLELQNETSENKLKGIKTVVKDVKKETTELVDNEKRQWYFGGGIALAVLGFLTFLLLRSSKNYKSKYTETAAIQEELQNKEKKIENLEIKMSDLHHEVTELARKNESNFYPRFLDLFPDFEKKLLEINPKLTNSELQFCALLKLNFSSKEIAANTFTAVRTVQNKKYRIRSKLNIPNETDTYVFFNSIT